MKQNNNISNNNKGCITSDMLIKYIKGELSGLERNQIERHIASCEMCSDELEGLSSLKDPDEIDGIVTELNAKVDEIANKKVEVISAWGTYFRVAASIALLIGISTLIYFAAFRNAPSTMISDNAAFEIDEPSAIQESKLKQDTKEIAGIKKMENQGFALSETSKRSTRTAKSEEESNKVEDIFVAPVVVDSVSVILADEVLMEDEKLEIADSVSRNRFEAVASNQAAAEAYAPVKAERAEKKKLFSRKSISKMDAASGTGAIKELVLGNNYYSGKEAAIKLYNNRKYENALSIFSRLYKDFPENDTIQYYTSMCNYHLNRFEESTIVLVQLQQQPQSSFYNEGKWYYTLCLIKTGKLSEVDSLLQTIIKENSPFSNDAKLKSDSLHDTLK